jgi:hypothetical protein
MKTTLSAGPRGLLASVIISVALAGPGLRAAGGLPTVAKPALNAPVAVTDNGATWTMDNGGLAVAVNGKAVGTIRPVATNALRYNTDRGVWREYSQPFAAALLKAGENQIQLTVPAGDFWGPAFKFQRAQDQGLALVRVTKLW